MSRYTPTRTNNPCILCEDTSGKCRTLSSGSLLLCMTHAGHADSVPGYRFLGPTKDGLWGKWKPESEHHLTEQDRETWRLQQQAIRRQRQIEKRRRMAQSMPVVERDRHYRNLLAELTLHPDDRADLIRRGFTDSQIREGGFKSVVAGQRLSHTHPRNLPGIAENRQSLRVAADGYLCPVRDPQGRIQGMQLRVRGASENKYRWLSSTENSVNLPNGELPLAVFIPNTGVDSKALAKPSRNAIALVEGTGAKPFITAERLGITTVGAAGGQFAASPETLRSTLETLSAKLNTKHIQFFPDAGSIENRHVLRQYVATWNLLEQWGYSVQVGWWGQVSKAEPDIDELDELEAISLREGCANAFLSTEAFLAMVPDGILPNGDSYQSSDFQLEPDRDEYAIALAQQAEAERIEAVLAKEQQQQVRERYRAETDRIMAESNTLRLQPTMKVSGRYIPSGSLPLPDAAGVVLVDGPMGVGKTSTALKELVEQHRRKFPTAFRCLLTPRNALGRQSATVLRLPHHSEFKGFGACPNEVTLCPESGWRFPIDRLPSGPPLILIDEVSQLLHQVLEGKTSKQNHALILTWMRSLFQWVKQQGGWIVLSEDGITNLEIDLIAEASGLPVAEFLQFERTELQARTITLFDSPSLTWTEMKRRLTNGENLVLASDSAKWLHETREMAIALGIDPKAIYIIDSDSSSEPWAQQLSANPDGWIKNHRPRILGYSPTFQQGISIADPDGYFQAMAIHLVHLDWRSAKQMPERLRTNVDRFGYMKQRGACTDEFFSSCRPETIIRDFYRNVEGVEKLTQFAQYAQSKGATDANGVPLDLVGAIAHLKASQHEPGSDFGFWLHHYARYQARGTYNRLSLRKNLVQLWESRGYTVQIVEGEAKTETQERRQIKERLAIANASAFAQLDPGELSVAEAQAILGELDATKEQRELAHKRLLQDKLPGVDLDHPEFVLKVLVQNNGRFLKTAELLWMAQNPEVATWLDRWTWMNEFTQATRRGQFVSYTRLSWRSGQAKLLNECPLQSFVNGGVDQWDNHTPEAIAVHQWAVLHRRQFFRYLRLTISEDHPPVKTVNKLLRKLGYAVKFKNWQNRERQYVITNLIDVDREAILKALKDRFLKHLEHKEGIVEPEISSPAIATRIDLPLLTSCDRPASFEGVEPQSEVMKSWEEALANAENEDQRRAIIVAFERYIRAIA